MPPAPEITAGLEAIANEWRAAAILWHLAVAAALLAVVAGWRPTRAVAGALLALPLASVSAFAWVFGNPFNGVVFAAGAFALAAIARRLPGRAPRIGPPWLVAIGVVLAAFGWGYPHFLRTGSRAAYLYAAPLGLIPCPTLSLVTGIALVVRGLDSRAWSLVLAATGLFYGLVGWLRLGVSIDVVLLVGALVLAVASAAGFGYGDAPSPTGG